VKNQPAKILPWGYIGKPLPWGSQRAFKNLHLRCACGSACVCIRVRAYVHVHTCHVSVCVRVCMFVSACVRACGCLRFSFLSTICSQEPDKRQWPFPHNVGGFERLYECMYVRMLGCMSPPLYVHITHTHNTRIHSHTHAHTYPHITL